MTILPLIIAPDERLSWPRTIGIGAQHVVAMFGATFLVPLLTGFPVSTTLLFSGLGTILFLLLTRNKLPSYLGSSFAFIAPITALNGGQALETPEQIGQALVGVFIAGVLLAGVGFLVQATGTGWIEKLMPPVVSGAIVALIGLNLAPVAWQNFQADALLGTVTLVACILFAVLFRGFLGRISIFLGVVVGYIVAVLMGKVDFTAVGELVEQGKWFGLPEFHLPSFADPVAWGLLPMFLPVVLVLIAENVGHVKSVASMTGQDLDPMMGRALVADGLHARTDGFTSLAVLLGAGAVALGGHEQRQREQEDEPGRQGRPPRPCGDHLRDADQEGHRGDREHRPPRVYRHSSCVRGSNGHDGAGRCREARRRDRIQPQQAEPSGRREEGIGIPGADVRPPRRPRRAE